MSNYVEEELCTCGHSYAEHDDDEECENCDCQAFEPEEDDEEDEDDDFLGGEEDEDFDDDED